MSFGSRVALFTTVYPAAAKYLSAWADSVEAQTDRDLELYVAVDAMGLEDVHAAMGRRLDATWVIAEVGDTPATLRGRAIELMVARHAAVVFVDSDDLLLPHRVAHAREGLAAADAVACALELVDEQARPLGVRLPDHPPGDIAARMPISNVFGLSNTAYDARLLKRCLPLPPECALVDWYLATRALLQQGRLACDPRPAMLYRQHPQNMAKLLAPTVADLKAATALVRRHHALVLLHAFAAGDPRRDLWQRRANDVALFERTLDDPERGRAYVAALNEIGLEITWWESVASPRLEALWRS